MSGGAAREPSPELLATMRGQAAELVGSTAAELSTTEPLGALGFDSIQTVELQVKVEREFGADGLVFTPADDLATLALRVEEALARDGRAVGDRAGRVERGVRTMLRRLPGR